MTSKILACIVVAALPGFSVPALAQANFTGTWVLDRSQSEGLPEGLEQTMVVKHTGGKLEIETTLSGPMGEQTVSDAYVLDGKEVDFVPPVLGGGSGKGKRTARWLSARNGFEATERAVLEGSDGEVEIRASRKWTLARTARR